MTRYQQACEDARHLLGRCYDGVLSTLSTDLPGYPFGSVMPFCLDRAGQPVILIANIAQHTRNVRHDPRVSLIVFDRAQEDLQTHGRLTFMCDAEHLSAEHAQDPANRYFRFFPETRDFRQTHDFEFWTLVPRRIRYIGGFGDIHWLQPSDLIEPNPFDEPTERHIVEHMNTDHSDALRRYLGRADQPSMDTPAMVGIDARGIHVRAGARIDRCVFQAPVRSAEEARQALVRMARAQPPTAL